MKKFIPHVFAFLAFSLPFVLYLYHLAPTYIPVDSAEFTLCMKFWGLCHPPGFPLYVIVGHIFFAVFSFGEVIWRANLLSAIYGALTILFVYLTLARLKVDLQIALLGALFLAVSTSFWEFSLSADVFTFGTFLVTLSLYLAFCGKKLPAMFVLGLSASHFYLTAVLWPIYVWYFSENSDKSESQNVRKSDGRSKMISILTWGFVFGLGFFPQILMYFRMQANPEINWGHHSGLAGFVDYARRKEFGSGFLLSNPALIYNPLKNFKQIWFFVKAWFFEFGMLMPVLGILGVFYSKVEARREYLMLFYCFFAYAFVQLFLLSTIDPGGEGNPFQLNKFYLVPFLFGTLFTILGIDYLVRRFFEEFRGAFLFLLGALVFIYLLVNWQTISMRGNYFSRNLVLDSLDSLPANSIAITVDHLVYFGALYEQKVNHAYTDKTILYFPNEKNRDNEFYHPDLFERSPDQNFMESVRKQYNLGGAENYVLDTIAKNLDRDVYILQGDFEYNFFRFLTGNVEPFGLWQRVNRGEKEKNADLIAQRFSKLRNTGFAKSDFFLKQQGFEASVYAISYYVSGLKLAELGDYGTALGFFDKSLAIDPTKTNVNNDIRLVARVDELWQKFEELKSQKDVVLLSELGDGLFTIKNYKDSILVYDALLSFGEAHAKTYNNKASAYANLGDMQKARDNYKKALELEPDLDIAKKALEQIKDK